MRLFGKLKEWSEDEPESLPELASTDEPIKELCLQLLKAAGSLQRFERSAPDLFTAPVESKFISNWRDFEKRFVPALLTVRFNALMSREWDFSSFGYEHSPGWEDADQEAARAEVLIESMMNGELEAIMSLGHSRHDGDMAEVAVKPVAASTAESRGPRISINAFPKEFKEKVIAIYTFRNELLERARLCDDELLKSKLNNMLTSLSLMGIDDYGVPIEDALKEAREDWKSLKDEAGLDLRGVFRRRALVPFVLFPRHVAAHQGRTDKLSIYPDFGCRSLDAHERGQSPRQRLCYLRLIRRLDRERRPRRDRVRTPQRALLHPVRQLVDKPERYAPAPQRHARAVRGDATLCVGGRLRELLRS